MALVSTVANSAATIASPNRTSAAISAEPSGVRIHSPAVAPT